MFKTSIASTPLTSDAANAYFHNIYGDNFGSDNSFVATLRALVAPRMKEDEHIYLMFGQSNFDTTALSSAPTERVVQAICRNYELNDTHGAIIIHSFTSQISEQSVQSSRHVMTDTIVSTRLRRSTISLLSLTVISIPNGKMLSCLSITSIRKSFTICRFQSWLSCLGTLTPKQVYPSLKWNSFTPSARQLRKNTKAVLQKSQRLTTSRVQEFGSCLPVLKLAMSVWSAIRCAEKSSSLTMK